MKNKKNSHPVYDGKQETRLGPTSVIHNPFMEKSVVDTDRTSVLNGGQDQVLEPVKPEYGRRK